MTTQELRMRARDILGVAVPPGDIRNVLKDQDASGRVGNKQIISLIALLFEAIEDFESME